MIRSWGLVTLGAAAVPWFGDSLAAAFVPAGGSNNTSTVQLASTTRYRQGDRIILGIGQAGANIVLVDNIPDATHLKVRSEGGAALSAWANATLISLAIRCFKVRIQALDGNTGTIWLGTDNTVTNAGGGTAFYQLQKVAAAATPNYYEYGFQNAADALGTQDGWLVGTAADKYAISAEVN